MNTTSGYFNDYVQKSALAPTTIELKSRAVRYFIELFGDIDPADVGYTVAEDYFSWLRKGRAAGGVNTYIRNIKPFFSWLLRRGKIKENPFNCIKLLPEDRPFRPPYSGDELARLMRVADLRWQVIILLAVEIFKRYFN